jgi:hypothetical protein
MDIYTYIIENSSATHAGIAKIVHQAFKHEYRVHIIGKTAKWFKLNEDGELSLIDDIIVRKRLSTDVADMVIEARKRFKDKKSEYQNMELLIEHNKSLEKLNLSLKVLVEKQLKIKEINNIDSARNIGIKIRDTEFAIQLISKKRELYRADINDRKFHDLTTIEDKLYNSSFKDGIMKALVELFYVELEN